MNTMRDFSGDHRWLSINTATIRKSGGADLPLPDIIEACARRGIRAISPWRDQVAAAGQPLPLSETHARLMRDAIAAGDGDLDNAAIIRQWRRDRSPSS